MVSFAYQLGIYKALGSSLERYRIADLPIRIHGYRQHPNIVHSSVESSYVFSHECHVLLPRVRQAASTQQRAWPADDLECFSQLLLTLAAPCARNVRQQ